MPRKGKEVAGKGKRKLDDDKSGGGRKRKNPNVLQFFEDAADEAYESSDSDLDDLFDDDFDMELKVESEPGKADSLPVFPKEEEMDEEDFDKMMEERYKDLSRFTYAGDGFETRRSVERNSFMPLVKDPTIWKVKCMVNRERHSAFCLMQKYVDLQSLGTKLQIISAFAVDHLKGHIYIEAHRQCDVVEACKGLCSIYATRVWAVPQSEVSHLLCVRHKYSGVTDGMWARVKNGKYKGDLAQVVAVNDERKRATVKLIPRIDLQALAQKFGSGVPIKRTATPAPRLISPSELEEFRPLIQYRRDRDTGLVFENLDSLMLKDGYVYKKVSIDSLNCSGVMPTEDELLKFKPAENEQSGDMEWLSQLYGEQKKKRIIKFEKGGGKGESSSGVVTGGGFELHDLVCFGRKDFGLVIGTEKDDSYKILKEGSEGPIVVTLPQNELKNGLFDAKFTALDKSMKSISINDSVRVLDGPCQGRLGIVKQIYRGTIFLYDETEAENGGYFCSKSQMCEKIKPSTDPFSDKGGESGPSGFDGFPSSPKSPLSPKNPWQARENKRDFNQGDKDGMFSIGQTLRIRLGPLKGYLCRVLAIRRSDITVKLDSQQKVLTVKSEHLCEVRGKSSSISMSEDPTSSTLKSCDLLGNQGSSSDWISAAGTSTEGGGWNTGGPSTERSSWPSFPASGIPVQPDSNSTNPFGSASNDPKEDVEGTAWDNKLTSSNQNVSWGTSAAKEEAVVNSSQAGDWSKSTDSWSKATSDGHTGSSAPAWGKANPSNSTNPFGSASNDPKADVEGTAWDNKLTSSNQNVSWGTSAAKEEAVVNNSQAGDWCKSTDSWSKATSDGRAGSSAPAWGKANPSSDPKEADVSGGKANWGNKKSSEETTDWSKGGSSNHDQTDGWNSPKDSGAGGSTWGNKKSSEETTDWSKGGSSNHDQTDSWNKPKDSGAGGSTWGKLGGGSWNKQDGDSSWERPKSFDGGRGYGGRGGGRGGRDLSGGLISSSYGQSTGWNREDGQEKNDNWKKSGAAGEDTGFGGRKGWGADKESGENQESGWGKKNTWNSGSSEVGGNQDSGWGKKSTWNSGSSEVGGNQDSGWGKKSTWNSGSSGGGNEDSGWGKKSTWNSGSSGNQDSDWGKKSSWNSGDASDGNEFAAGGNWRGGRGGRGGSDRGGFRGRGSYGDRGGSDGGGGFGGRGRSDRGGFGGRGRSDRGGFGGRGGDRGGFGGRVGDRGGFGGRGRGRDQGGGWNNRNDSGEDRPSSWSTGANNNNEGWKSNDGGSSWNQGSGASKQGGGWGQGSNPTYEAAGGSSWKSSDASGGDQWSSWNKPSVTKEVKGAQDQESGWSKGPAWGDQAKDAKDNSWGKAPASSWGGDNQGSAKTWNQPKAAGGPASGDQAKDAKDNSWGKAPASSWGQPSGWKESTDPKEGTNGSGEATDSWGKAASSSWGKGGDNGGSKGGW